LLLSTDTFASSAAVISERKAFPMPRLEKPGCREARLSPEALTPDTHVAICEIGVALVRPAEFIIFRIHQNTAEAQA
jgi:hypothetical protein